MSVLSLIPVALGFFGLGTGYMIYGPWEFFGKPAGNTPEEKASINRTLGQWGIWMPGFMQFVTGTYLFLGLTIFPASWNGFPNPAPLYMAALAFTAFGVHWFALGYNRYKSSDMRVDGYMAFAFVWITIVGQIVFYHASTDVPVAILFTLLMILYITDIPASLLGTRFWVRIKGLVHIVTGIWLMYLVFAAALTLTGTMSVWV